MEFNRLNIAKQIINDANNAGFFGEKFENFSKIPRC